MYVAQQEWTLAEGYFQESQQLAQAHNFPVLALSALFELGLMYYAKGDPDKALYTLDDALRECEEKSLSWLAHNFEKTIFQKYGNGLLNLLRWARQQLSPTIMQHLLPPHQ